MKKINKFMDKFFKLAPGGIYALISMAIGVIFIFISISQFPGYDMTKHDVSLLGIGPGLSAPLFSAGLILTGLTAIPFFIYLGRILQRETVNEKLRRRTVRISIIGCVSLAIIGCFPVLNLIMYLFHAIFAATFFVCGFLFCILFSILILKDDRFSKIQAYIGFIVAVIFAIYLILRWAITEWAVFFAILFWVIENGIYTLYKKF